MTYGTDPGVTDLFKALRQQHPKLQAVGPRGQEIQQIVRSFSAVLDALNPLRNKASVAHPNQVLLDAPEADL
jgi:hypothetical protein